MAEKMLAQPLEFRVDMRGGLMEQPQRAKLMRGDKNATRVSVMLYDGENFCFSKNYLIHTNQTIEKSGYKK